MLSIRSIQLFAYWPLTFVWIASARRSGMNYRDLPDWSMLPRSAIPVFCLLTKVYHFGDYLKRLFTKNYVFHKNSLRGNWDYCLSVLYSLISNILNQIIIYIFLENINFFDHSTVWLSIWLTKKYLIMMTMSQRLIQALKVTHRCWKSTYRIQNWI